MLPDSGRYRSAWAGVSVQVMVLAPAAAATTYTITDLGSLGYGVSDGLAINASGQVTGYSYTGATVPTSGCCGNCYSSHRIPCVAHIPCFPVAPPGTFAPTRPRLTS